MFVLFLSFSCYVKDLLASRLWTRLMSLRSFFISAVDDFLETFGGLMGGSRNDSTAWTGMRARDLRCQIRRSPSDCAFSLSMLGIETGYLWEMGEKRPGRETRQRGQDPLLLEGSWTWIWQDTLLPPSL